MPNSFEAAALSARIVTTTALPELDLTPAHFKGLPLDIVFMLLPMLHDKGRDVHGPILKTLAELVDTGKVEPLLDSERFAFVRLTSGQALGNFVVEF